jgi:hypothetical protein
MKLPKQAAYPHRQARLDYAVPQWYYKDQAKAAQSQEGVVN